MAAATPAMAKPPSTNPSILSFFPSLTPAGNAGGANLHPAGANSHPAATPTPNADSAPAETPPAFDLKQFAFAANGSHRADAFSPETGKALAATPTTGSELIEELRTKNKKLEAENSKLKTENAALKRKLKDSQASNGAGAGAAAAAGPPAKKQKPLDCNKLIAKWGKALVKAVPREKFDTCCGGEFKKVVVTEQGMLQEVFLAVFDGKGTLIQPTKDNKPTSVVTIRKFDSFEAVEELFGAQNIQRAGYTASMWRKRSFQKSYKSGESPATLRSLELQYNRNKLSLELHFGIEVDDEYW